MSDIRESFEYWDDLDDGDYIEVTCRSGIVRSGKLGGFYRRRTDIGFEYWCDILTDRGWLCVPTQNILGIRKAAERLTWEDAAWE